MKRFSTAACAILAAVFASGTLALASHPALASYAATYMTFTIVERGDPGPTYADNMEAALVAIDAHDHTTGKGTKVPTAGINVNADVEFNVNDATELRTLRFDTGVVTTGASDRRALYQIGGELAYIDESGNITTITNNGAVNGTPGSISGMHGSATVVYQTSVNDYVFTDDLGVPAGGDFGNVRIAEQVSGGKGPVLTSDPATLADFNWIFPSALPVANRALCLNATGNLSTCTASAAAEAFVVATSTSSATMSTSGDGAIGDDLIVYGDLEVRGDLLGRLPRISTVVTSNSTTSPSSVTGFSWSVTAGQTVRIQCDLLVTTAATTTGVQVGLDAGSDSIRAECTSWNAAGTFTRYAPAAADDVACAIDGHVANNSEQFVRLIGGWTNAAGTETLTVRVRSEVGTSQVNVLAGSSCIVQAES